MSFAQPQFRAPQKPSDPAFETKEMTIESAGQKLYGIACIPVSGPAKKPAIIMSHGYGGNSMGFYEWMAQLAKEGYICYALDFCGGGRVSQSEGDTRQMSVLTEKQNLLDALQELRSWDCVDLDNVFLLGESQGGCVSAITAPEVQDQVKAIVLKYPAFCIRDDAHKFYPTRADLPEEVNFMGLNIGYKYYDDIYDYDVYSVFPAYEKDVLLIHGDKDQVVNISYAEKAVPLYKNCEYHVLPGAGHGFWGEQEQECRDLVSAFLKKEVSK